MSPALAHAVAKKLGIQGHVPSAFQARIAGAKGMWIADPHRRPELSDSQNSNLYDISISPSQVKFKNHLSDRAGDQCPENHDRLTFEVIGYSMPLRSALISRDLLPILEDRGVDKSVFQKFLRDDIYRQVYELKEVVSDRHLLRKWNHDHGFLSRPEDKLASVGTLPRSKYEKVNTLLDVSKARPLLVFPNSFRVALIQENVGFSTSKLRDVSRINATSSKATSAFPSDCQHMRFVCQIQREH